MSSAVGARWFRESGGMPSLNRLDIPTARFVWVMRWPLIVGRPLGSCASDRNSSIDAAICAKASPCCSSTRSASPRLLIAARLLLNRAPRLSPRLRILICASGVPSPVVEMTIIRRLSGDQCSWLPTLRATAVRIGQRRIQGSSPHPSAASFCAALVSAAAGRPVPRRRFMNLHARIGARHTRHQRDRLEREADLGRISARQPRMPRCHAQQFAMEVGKSRYLF